MAKPNDDGRNPQSDRTDRGGPLRGPAPHDKRHPPDGNPGDDQIEHMPGHGERHGDRGGKRQSRQARPRYANGVDEYGTRFV